MIVAVDTFGVPGGFFVCFVWRSERVSRSSSGRKEVDWRFELGFSSLWRDGEVIDCVDWWPIGMEKYKTLYVGREVSNGMVTVWIVPPSKAPQRSETNDNLAEGPTYKGCTKGHESLGEPEMGLGIGLLVELGAIWGHSHPFGGLQEVIRKDCSRERGGAGLLGVEKMVVGEMFAIRPRFCRVRELPPIALP